MMFSKPRGVICHRLRHRLRHRLLLLHRLRHRLLRGRYAMMLSKPRGVICHRLRHRLRHRLLLRHRFCHRLLVRHRLRCRLLVGHCFRHRLLLCHRVRLRLFLRQRLRHCIRCSHCCSVLVYLERGVPVLLWVLIYGVPSVNVCIRIQQLRLVAMFCVRGMSLCFLCDAARATFQERGKAFCFRISGGRIIAGADVSVGQGRGGVARLGPPPPPQPGLCVGFLE